MPSRQFRKQTWRPPLRSVLSSWLRTSTPNLSFVKPHAVCTWGNSSGHLGFRARIRNRCDGAQPPVPGRQGHDRWKKRVVRSTSTAARDPRGAARYSGHSVRFRPGNTASISTQYTVYGNLRRAWLANASLIARTLKLCLA